MVFIGTPERSAHRRIFFARFSIGEDSDDEDAEDADDDDDDDEYASSLADNVSPPFAPPRDSPSL